MHKTNITVSKYTGIKLFFGLLIIFGESALFADSSTQKIQTFWVQIGQDFISCPLDSVTNSCPIEGLGWGSFDPLTGVAHWHPSTPQDIGGLGVEGSITLEEKSDWYDLFMPRESDSTAPQGSPKVVSNGFQSWSLSGLIDIPGPKSLIQLSDHAVARDEEFRDGTDHSWEFGVVLNPNQYHFMGALSAKMWRPWVRYWQDRNSPEKNRTRFFAISGMTGDQVSTLKNATISSEPWFFSTGSTTGLPYALQKYQATLDQHRQVHNNPADPNKAGVRFGWNSWYHLWNGVAQKDVDQNLEIVADIIPRLLKDQNTQNSLVATVDDGWQQRWGDWSPNTKFPKTLTEMAQGIGAKGFVPGIWLAPFLVSITSPLIKKNPDWFVQTTDFEHPSGRYKILDTTHPDVVNHLKKLMNEVKSAGFGFVKLDFLYVGTFLGRRYKNVTSMQAYEIGLALIRETLGPQVEILACGAPHLASRPYVDRWRIGPDIAYQFPTGQPTWVDLDIQLRNLGARWFLCRGLACDSDPWLMRGRRPLPEVATALWVASLMGNGFTLSDDFQRVSLSRQHYIPDSPALTQAVSGIPARPSYRHWMGYAVRRLEAAQPIDREFDRKNFHAPQLWHTSNHGQVFLNFSNRPYLWHGDLLLPRQSRFHQDF